MSHPTSCVGCALDCHSKDFSQIEGTGSLGVLIVGEASGQAEDQDELPFRPRAASGSLLERCFKRLGYNRQQFALTNIVRCRPPNNQLLGAAYEHAAINHCRPNLDEAIRTHRPRCILALGGIAARELTGRTGYKQGIEAIRGFVLPSRYDGIPVVASYHPAFLRRGKMAWMGALLRDMELAVAVAKDGAPTTLAANYLEMPNYDDTRSYLHQLRNNPAIPIAYDIETAYSQTEDEDEVASDPNAIILIQFSEAPGQGIAMPWSGEYVDIAKAILALPNPKIAFNNWIFDDPKLEAAGCTIAGRNDDLMWMYHHLQPDLPRNLQSVASMFEPAFGPWKHTAGMNLAGYGCKDVDILQRIYQPMKQALVEKGLWDGYDRHVRQLWPILRKMSQRGIPMSPTKQAEFSEYLETNLAKVDADLQALYPDHLKELHPEKGYVHDPSDTRGLVHRSFNCVAVFRDPCDCLDRESGEITGWTKKVATRCATCKGTGYVRVKRQGEAQRWVKVLPFKPSPPQLIKYMRYRGHKVPKVIGGDADTTAKLFIERMARDYKDGLYKGLLEYRSLQKMRGTYLWSLGDDNRVHPTFLFSPATGQLAARAPNVMTIPKEASAGPIANRFRETIEARPGYALLAIDFAGFHTSTFAFEAQDLDYFRLASTIGDPHSFITAKLLGLYEPEQMLAMPDDELRAILAGIKKKYKLIRDGQAKPAILGFALGLGANKLFEQNRYNPDTGAGFKKRSEAEGLITTLKAAFPRGAAYQDAVRLLAYQQSGLTNRYGYHRYFYDVMHHSPATGMLVPGDDAEAAIAFNVQCDAHGYLKEALLRLEAGGLLDKYGLCNLVHDECFFEIKLELLYEALDTVVVEMENPSTVLIDNVIAPGGLVVRAEPSVGWNRAAMMAPEKFFATEWKRGVA